MQEKNPFNISQLSKPLQDFIGFHTEDLIQIFAEKIIGVYIHGSLSYGGFDEQRSNDIDLIILLRESFGEKEKKELCDFYSQEKIKKNPWYSRSEIDYVLQSHIAQNIENSHNIHFSGGKLQLNAETDASMMNTWINLKDCGITLYGTDIQELIPEIPKDTRIASFRKVFEDIKESAPKWQNIDPWNQVYIISVLCLVVYNLHFLSLTNKRSALKWYRENVPGEYADIIMVAQEKIGNSGGPAEHFLCEKIPKFIKYVETLFPD